MVRWQLSRIPPPPAGLIAVLAATVISFLLYNSLVKSAHGAAIPYYTGKPPPSPHYPGRCWCSTHGPRGGCIKWICRPKVAQTYDLTGTIDGLAGDDYVVSGTATFSNNAWTVNGKLTSTKLQCQTINAPNGTLTDPSGAVWSWGGPSSSGNNRRVLRNGSEVTVGVAISLLNSVIYVRGNQGLWFQSPDWNQLPGAPAGC